METVSTNERSGKGAMWELERNLDQPMDAEAGRLRNMYREKVIPSSVITSLSFRYLNFGQI
jgi:KUP system potassium uptake protein